MMTRLLAAVANIAVFAVFVVGVIWTATSNDFRDWWPSEWFYPLIGVAVVTAVVLLIMTWARPWRWFAMGLATIEIVAVAACLMTVERNADDQCHALSEGVPEDMTELNVMISFLDGQVTCEWSSPDDAADTRTNPLDTYPVLRTLSGSLTRQR